MRSKKAPRPWYIRMIIIFSSILLACILFAALQLVWVRFNGQTLPRPAVSKEPVTAGQGKALRYAVLGDSTAVSQGGIYTEGYAVASAAFLAQNHQVTWVNLGVPGARAADIMQHQVDQAAAFKPDVALIAVGANDVTHLTPLPRARESLIAAITQLQTANPNVRIILTGAPDMGSVPRFTPFLRWLAGKRTRQFNYMAEQVAREHQAIFAPIAATTGPIYRAHPELFSIDKFHPTTDGYDLWTPIIIEALVQALATSRD